MHTPVAAECAWADDSDAAQQKVKETDPGTAESKSDAPTERTALSGPGDVKVEDLEPVSVARGPVLAGLVGLQVAALAASLLLGAAHAAALWADLQHPLDSTNDVVEAALRAYALFFCGCVAVVELELFGSDEATLVGRSWPLRGVAYGFVGLSALATTTDGARRPRAPAAWRHDRLLPYDAFTNACAACTCGVGLCYFALGLCCCRRLKHHRALEYRKQLAQAELRATFLAELAARGGELTANPC